MQLGDLVKPIEDMTDEELRERLQNIRHRQKVERPAAKAHKEKEVKKAAKRKLNPIEKLLDGLSPSEIEALMKELGK